MRHVVRFLLIGFLAVALPLQGTWAATMLACAGHRGHLGAGVDPHGGDATAAHAHRHDAGPRAPADIDHSKHGKTDPAKEAGPKCSACAACCLNAVVASEAVSFDEVDLPEHFARLVAPAPAVHMTDGPERPPRTFLA